MAPDREDMVKVCADLLRRMGVGQLRVGHSDEGDGIPVVWYATASFRTAGGAWEAAGAMTPERAMFRLCERACDGGKCLHCKRPTGVVDDTAAADMPAGDPMGLVCWYAYDPELKTFRRSCEGVVT